MEVWAAYQIIIKIINGYAINTKVNLSKIASRNHMVKNNIFVWKELGILVNTEEIDP